MICLLSGFAPECSLWQVLVETFEWLMKPENLIKNTKQGFTVFIVRNVQLFLILL